MLGITHISRLAHVMIVGAGGYRMRQAHMPAHRWVTAHDAIVSANLLVREDDLQRRWSGAKTVLLRTCPGDPPDLSTRILRRRWSAEYDVPPQAPASPISVPNLRTCYISPLLSVDETHDAIVKARDCHNAARILTVNADGAWREIQKREQPLSQRHLHSTEGDTNTCGSPRIQLTGGLQLQQLDSMLFKGIEV